MSLSYLLAASGLNQELAATLFGRVLDTTGAAAPNARVQAVNVATNETTTATTDVSGAYTPPFLRRGNYRLTVTVAGFRTFTGENIILQVSQIAGVYVMLEAGEVVERIEVTEQAALLETQTASRSSIVNTTQVTELPLNTRNPFMLGAMMSGVIWRGNAIWMRPFDNGAIAEWVVNGGRRRRNEFLLDGAPNHAQMGGNNIAYVPIVGAVQEFNIQTNIYDAQYGHTGGGIFNVVLKSGTSDFHFTAWEFMRRRSWDANTFQNNAIGAKRPDHKLDQYGFQLDGPAHIPGLLNTGASLGPLTFVGRNTSWFNSSFRLAFIRQFSLGFQYQVTRTATVDISYIGSRTLDENDSKAFNIPGLEFRKRCNLLEGGDPNFCDQPLPNPFRDVPAFAGTGFYTSTTLSRYQLNRPFPQFSGDMTELGRNHHSG